MTADSPITKLTINSVYPRVSIIILNAFHITHLIPCLESVTKTDYPNFEILVVDCLTPNIESFIKEEFPQVKLVKLNVDIGPAAMHNIGLEHCDSNSKHVAFLDNDTIVDKSWLKELVDCIESDPLIGAVQAKLLLHSQPSVFNTYGNKANYLAVGWPDGFGEFDTGQTIIKDITFPSGAAMLMRRAALEKIGLYDEDYFIYADDLDAGLRLRLAGYSIKYTSNSIVFHKYKFLKNSRNFYYLNRNRIQTFLKLYNKKTYLLLLPAVICYEMSVLGYAVINGFLMEFIQSYIFCLKNIKLIKGKRFKIKKFKSISDKDFISQCEGSINFLEISNHTIVKYFINPFLEKYQKCLIRSLL